VLGLQSVHLRHANVYEVYVSSLTGLTNIEEELQEEAAKRPLGH
jgi:hypothetical protein